MTPIVLEPYHVVCSNPHEIRKISVGVWATNSSQAELKASRLGYQECVASKRAPFSKASGLNEMIYQFDNVRD